MPRSPIGLFLNSNSEPTPYYNWTAGAHDGQTLYLESEHIVHVNPPYEVGLWTLLIKTTDAAGNGLTITPTLYFAIDNSGDYYESTGRGITALNSSDTTFTSGGTFIARLDTQSFWCFNNGFKIRLTRSGDDALVIDHAEVIAI